MRIRYTQAVDTLRNETENVKLMKSNPATAVCIYHKVVYTDFR